MISELDQEAIAEGDELVATIKPLLAGREPHLVGLVLAQLMSILLAGHNPEFRAESRRLLFRLVTDLTAAEVEGLIDVGLVGPEWREVTKQ